MATVREALSAAARTAIHLELRDTYLPGDEAFADWRAGVAFDPAERWRSWFDLVSATTRRGVEVRRARIVSEPVTDYIRFEYDVTDRLNTAAGELVRWLPRRRAADLLVPGCDMWVFDEATVVFNHFTGDGEWAPDGMEWRDDPTLAKRLVEAFNLIWDRAIPHGDYQPA